MKPSPITVTRPDPQTGEVIVEVVSASHFERKLSPTPAPDQAEVLADFWADHAEILTREERTAIANGSSHVVRPAEFPAAWKYGDVLEVATNLTAEVRETVRSLQGLTTKLRVMDFRPLFLKQTVGGGSRPSTDENGYAIEVTPGVAEAARIDGAYTRSPALAVPDSGDVMDDSIHRHLHSNQSAMNAKRRGRRKKRQTVVTLEDRIKVARGKNRKGEVRYLERQLRSLAEKTERRDAA